ncbi:MAG: excinuclease ABC subunit UvrA [Candidatus Korarchaeota archaeon]|nr:excinuclease ABC subunit UvrA [Candidatus Korarchaeota archaeon]NIU82214.1 excinuclease ABC subunit UvrA [Candidatus Thorarchaeota archaeon]NIW12677.1 excinuclease ABC subunit UvrA [Candidatus Thorarchaeota archaeon]NIW50884.1 excinuclease ABC subunit UvrA [Candidatus Korarchaeota archaeon]
MNRNSEKIEIYGAKEHNLKNLDIEIPKRQLVVVAGPSGSGKSSLAFDILYTEGRRRYVESLSSYARQFLGRMKKPEVERIKGLSPSIAVGERKVGVNPRSTVATITEIADYLRLLFAKVGTPHCPKCGETLKEQSLDEIIDQVLSIDHGTRLRIIAPVVRGEKGTFEEYLEDLKKGGFVRVEIDGNRYYLSDSPSIELNKYKKHEIDVVIDRVVNNGEIRSRLADSIQTALQLADGLVKIDVSNGDPLLFSETLSCPVCQVSLPELSSRMFSFNSPYGACPECDGLGVKEKPDPDLIFKESKSIMDGGIAFYGTLSKYSWKYRYMQALASKYNFSLRTPIKELDDPIKHILLYGTDEKIQIRYRDSDMLLEKDKKFEGIADRIERLYHETDSRRARKRYRTFISEKPCPVCHGKRLREESLSVQINEHSIADVMEMSTGEALSFFKEIDLTDQERFIAGRLLEEIKDKLQFLIDVGLDYLQLQRKANTLSTGESRRIELATELGSSLTGVLYVLDEPTIGLHPSQIDSLLVLLEELRDKSNSVLVIEHDPKTIRTADWVLELGPGAGAEGGEVVFTGPPEKMMERAESLTGKYLSGKKEIPTPQKRREGNGHTLTVKGAKEHNLQSIDVKFPLGKLICVTGVSGAGKSTLIDDILYKSLARKLHRAHTKPGMNEELEGSEHVDKVVMIDQTPVGKTPRSCVATYSKSFRYIRRLFSDAEKSKMRGYDKGYFSFNTDDGRCQTCRGLGRNKVDLQFLPPVYVECDACDGKRYNKEVLEVTYKGKNIAEVLDMTVDEALDFFENIPPLKRRLKVLHDVGLGYLQLGRPNPTLSGGENQRLKLARELGRRSRGHTLYLLDEPTTGAHMVDVQKLVNVLQKLVDKENTVIVIEHQLGIIKNADWIIDLGPGGGEKGGEIVAEGTPEDVMDHEKSLTGKYIAEVLS